MTHKLLEGFNEYIEANFEDGTTSNPRAPRWDSTSSQDQTSGQTIHPGR